MSATTRPLFFELVDNDDRLAYAEGMRIITAHASNATVWTLILTAAGADFVIEPNGTIRPVGEVMFTDEAGQFIGWWVNGAGGAA